MAVVYSRIFQINHCVLPRSICSCQLELGEKVLIIKFAVHSKVYL